jgi:dihydrofolate reductase
VQLLTCHLAVSLDGFLAGPNQSLENPLGEGGPRLHEWALTNAAWRAQHGLEGGERNADSQVIEDSTKGIGAYIMGRKMFGGDSGDGSWDESWTGWWGDEPPYHAPVFVLTHHPRPPLELSGTTFTFVTDGISSALALARAAAGEQNVGVAGGAQTVQQYLAAGLLDEMQLHIVPVILGAGERLLADVGDPALEQVEVIGSPTVTHVRYRIRH